MRLENAYHEGELFVQQRLGEVAAAERSGRAISDSLLKGARKYIEQQPQNPTPANPDGKRPATDQERRWPSGVATPSVARLSASAPYADFQFGRFRPEAQPTQGDMKVKTLFSATLFAALSISSLGCFSEAQSAANAGDGSSARIERARESRAYLHSFNLPSHGVAIEGYCPVAYFEVNKPVRGKPEHASTYNGVTYYFVSGDAKSTFDANPEKYIPAYGGWCAFGMAVQDKFPIDPESFKIVDGKLLLFLNNRNVDALKLWNEGNEKELLRKADAHWRKVQG